MKGEHMDDGIQAQIASLDARCKSNTHRINDLEADNKALHQLATSVEVLATKQETIEENEEVFVEESADEDGQQ